MKKSLLALAVLGAFAAGAQAQSTTNVSIGGVVSANVKSYKVSDISPAAAAAGRVAQRETRIDDDYNSRFWITGSEDLGGGLSALFYLENRVNTDQGAAGTGNGLTNGDTFLGLKGGFGQATLGRHSMMSVQGLTTEILTGTGTIAAMPSSAFATQTILNQAGGAMDLGTRRPNSFMYRSPNFSGFSGSLGLVASGGASAAGVTNEGQMSATAPGTTAPGALARPYDDGREVFAQVGYANGPLSVSFAAYDVKAEGVYTAAVATATSGQDLRQYRLSSFYKFGPAKVGLQVDRAQRELVGGITAGTVRETRRTAISLPVSVAFGNHTVLASATRARDLSGATGTLGGLAGASNIGADTGAKMYTLGWNYDLSKRTNVGVFYTRLNNDARGQYQPFLAGTTFTGSALLAGEKASTLALGVKHTF